ncbi:hypothetical protein C6341_g19778 [Phytophthora cactorum]|nr:hypothetical protein C6341_g19778 [Phytophthora cactorum]
MGIRWHKLNSQSLEDIPTRSIASEFVKALVAMHADNPQSMVDSSGRGQRVFSRTHASSGARNRQWKTHADAVIGICTHWIVHMVGLRGRVSHPSAQSGVYAHLMLLQIQ